MPRAIFAIFLASFFVSLPFIDYYMGAFWGLALFIILVTSLLIGIPALLILKWTKWNSWWHAVIIGGLVPQIFGIILSSIYTFVFFTGLGMGAGLTVWLAGMFRNPTFMSVKTKIPRSLVVTPFCLALTVIYLKALESEQVYGCITKYQLAENPTSWRYSIITVVADNGDVFEGNVTVGYSSPDLLGACAWGSKRKTANLQSYDYTFHGPSSDGCVQLCEISGK
jgi:hypothetical protein